jgi:hypothetical protein
VLRRAIRLVCLLPQRGHQLVPAGRAKQQQAQAGRSHATLTQAQTNQWAPVRVPARPTRAACTECRALSALW